MATTKKAATSKKSAKKKPVDILTAYMHYVLEHEIMPQSIFKFCKENKITEQEFYAEYGSFDAVRKHIWVAFHNQTMTLLHKSDDYAHYSNRERLLTYYYTLFEVMTANRSYILFVLDGRENNMQKIAQMSDMKHEMTAFAKALIQKGNEDKTLKITKNPEQLFSQAVWLQFAFLTRFWIKDTSKGFEKTDVAIEKSVNTAFDLFETSPLETVIDLGKFLWKERMM